MKANDSCCGCVCVGGVTQHDNISHLQEVEGLSGEAGFLLRFLTSAADFSEISHTLTLAQRGNDRVKCVCQRVTAHGRHTQVRRQISHISAPKYCLNNSSY